MLNSCVIVGRAASKPVFIEEKSKAKRKYATMKIECDAAFRNPDGSLTKELYDVLLWRGIAEECAAALQKGMVVAVRGHLSSVPVCRDEKNEYLCMIVAEKVVFERNLSKLKQSSTE